MPRSVSSISNPSLTGRADVRQAKEKVLSFIQQGMRVRDAMASVHRTDKTYEWWKKTDPEFKRRIAVTRAKRGTDVSENRTEVAGDFASFRSKYLGMDTFWHQLQWVDMLEGDEPRELHQSERYEEGDRNFVLINCPPEHAKTLTLSIDYVTYRVCKEPNIRILLVSETQKRAKEFLYAIQQRLTHPRYHELQLDFAPSGGFKGESTVWRQEVMYLGGELRDSGEKDPTIQALGVGGQIYGARADLIILDDCVVLSNAHLYEDQIRWIQQEVLTRLGPTGTLIIAGTRVDAIDLYREIRNDNRYPDGRSPWTYLAQPAVLEFADEPADWVTLWPQSDIPWPGSKDEPDGNGMYPRWDGKYLRKRRSLLDPKTWSMVYMQADVDEEAVFPAELVRSAVNGNRTAGPLQVENPYHRDGGMAGLHVICGMDPAMAGDTATVVYAVDLQTRKRYVLDAHRMTGPTPGKIRDKIMSFTERYRPQAWVIEKNAFQLFLTRDEEIRSYLASRGIIMREHFTGAQKLDPDFGVASIASLFKEGMIELPSPHNHEGTKGLIEQLVTWAPQTKNKQDLPMALWFCEIQARQVANAGLYRSRRHLPNPFLPRLFRTRQQVINVQEMQAA